MRNLQKLILLTGIFHNALAEVRLKSRGRTNVGTVEIRENDGWVEVCDQDWGEIEAKVVCREMGFVDGLAQCCSTLGVDKSGSSSDASTSRSFSHFRCRGHEKSLLDCMHFERPTKCPADHRASAICYNKPLNEVDMSFAVRLGNGSNSSQYWGEVNVRYKGVWGQVCAMGDNWNNNSAQIVCRQLGFKGGAAYDTVNKTFMPSWIVNLNCTGSEKSLEHCTLGPWGRPVRSCKPAYALCYQRVRLKSRGRTNVGTVEIRENDGWVEVCDQHWGEIEAKVVCREMGFVDGLAQCCSTLGVDKSGPSSDASMSKSFSHFRCLGHEKSLLDCAHFERPTKCQADHRASAICYNKPLNEVDMSFAVRLGNGSNNSQYWGEVNVRYKGVWGQVCAMGDNWNNKSAQIVCKQLGFKGGAAYGTVNETFMPSWIVNLNCTGSEKSLEHCTLGPWGRPVRSCKPAYALCYQRGIEVKLVGGGSYYGRVEITHDNHTGTICDEAWSTSDARVVCKYLNFADGDPVTGSYYGGGAGPIMMNGLGCYGYEKNIVQCRNKGWMTYKNTKCSDHKNDASVVCYKNVRLSRGTHSHGVVQIMEENWSILCGEGFSNKEANIVCKQLGFQDGIALAMGSFGTFYGKYVRPNISCNGTEDSIMDCSYDQFRACQKDSFLGYAVVSCFN